MPIDLIEATDPGERSLGGVAARMLELDLRFGEERVRGLRVAHSATLVVLKCYAWTERRESHDLADVARIALRDRFENHVARDGLAAIAAELPSWLERTVREAAREFASADGRGASAFIATFRAEIVGLSFDEDRELGVRETVSAFAVEMFSRIAR